MLLHRFDPPYLDKPQGLKCSLITLFVSIHISQRPIGIIMATDDDQVDFCTLGMFIIGIDYPFQFDMQTDDFPR